MKLASYVLASYQRPQILDECLRLLQRTVAPSGWGLEIVVCVPEGDRGVVRPDRVRFVSASRTDVGSQLSVAFAASLGELILVTGDDDFHPSDRLTCAAAAYEAGHRMSGLRSFFVWCRATGKMTRWKGSARRSGATRNYARDVLEAAGGWGEASRGADGQLDDRIAAAGIPLDVHDLGHGLASRTVITRGRANISAGCPFPEPGQFARRGQFRVRGATRAEYATMPQDIKDAMRRIWRLENPHG